MDLRTLAQIVPLFLPASASTAAEPTSPKGLQLCQISVKPEYVAEWDIHQNDFLLLTRDGEVVRDTLYRVGGMGTSKIANLPYFLLLKQVEAVYSKDIIQQSKGNKTGKHLAQHWCILDHLGNERVVCKGFSSPYLVKNSLLYSVDGVYYNIETGERYGKTSGSSMEAAEYVFLNTQYDKQAVAQGILKINKKDGSWEVFPV